MATSDYELVFLLIALFLTLIKGSQVISRRIGLPDVLGELIVGIVLGPTVLGILFLQDHPTSSLSNFLHIDQIHLDLTGDVINFISEFAVLLLLFKVGMEVDFDDLKKVQLPAFVTAVVGIVLPIAAGFLFIYIVVPISNLPLIPEGKSTLNAAIFMGATLTATSIGISTRLFLDLGKIRSLVAQTVVGAAIMDDIIAVALFSIIVAYLGNGEAMAGNDLVTILINIAIFFFVSFLLFKYALPWFFQKTRAYTDKSVPIFVSIALMLYMAVFAQILGLAPIIGAFVGGVIVGNEDEYLDIEDEFEPIASWIIPFFFLDIGLSVNLIEVLGIIAIEVAIVLVILAILSKFLAGIAGTYYLDNYSHGESRAIGLSMAARGEVTLIFAFEGYLLGFFTDLFYGVVILAVVLIIFVIIPLIKYAARHWIPDEEKPKIVDYPEQYEAVADHI